MYVLDGHRTADPVGSMYAVTVSCESARIASTYTVLNNHDILQQTYEMTACNIGFKKELQYM